MHRPLPCQHWEKVREGETWDSENKGVHSSPEGGGLRAHAELLKWGNIPESELSGA